MHKCILFADDLSKRAEKALRSAVEMAHCFQAKLYIINVREDFLNKDELVMLRVDLSDFLDDTKKKAVEIKRRIELDVDALSGVDMNYEIILREGKPADVICDVARELNADLIVVGSHGASPWKDALLGSTAHTVLKNAGRSVLTVWTKD